MNRKILVSVITIIALMTAIIGYQWANKDETYVYADRYRDGIMLTPTDIDSSGLGLGTDFIMSFEEGTQVPTQDEVQTNLHFNPELAFGVEKNDEGYLIKLNEILKEGSIYEVAYNSVTWIFQTYEPFEVVGSLPRNEGTNVNIDAGIEMFFSHEGARIQDYFTIEPEVKGGFESFGNTVVFVPKGLEPMTMYTVTLKAGLPLSGSDEILEEDYVFSFETGYGEGDVTEQKGYFSYNRILNDFSSSESKLVPINYQIYDGVLEKGMDEIETKVYAYSGLDGFLEDLDNSFSVPTWRNYANPWEGVDVKGLDKVATVVTTLEEAYGYESFVVLPDDLEKGFYVLKSTWDDLTFETFVQVSDLSYYGFADKDRQYYWLHELETGEPAVEALGKYHGVEATSDNGGLLSFDKTDSDNVVYSVFSYEDNETVALEPVIYDTWYGETGNSDYWKNFQTDRNLYQPNDKVYFYGFLKDRTSGETPEQVTVELKEQRWYYDWYFGGFDDDLPYARTTLEVQGGFYEGSIDIPGLAEGSYLLEVSVGSQVVSSYYLQVEKYVKPDYKMTVSSDKEAIFLNEKVTFTMNTSFYEGTPVSDLDIRYNTYGINYDDGMGVTDEDGNVTMSYTPKYQSGYQGIVYSNLYATATLPESSELYGEKNVLVFVNDIDVVTKASLEDEVGTVSVDVHSITLDRLNDGTAENQQDYLDQPVMGQRIEGVIYRNEWIKEQIGEYYDYNRKMVVPRYNYYTDRTVFDQVVLITDAQGHGEKNLDLPKEANVHYDIEWTTSDSKDHTMTFNNYFGEERYFYYRSDSLMIESNQDTYHVGDSLSMTLVKGDEEVSGQDYLWLGGLNGLVMLEHSQGPKLETTFNQNFVPNVQMVGVVFNGNNYETSQYFYPTVDIEDYRATLNISSDQDSYKPGDTVTVNVVGTYVDGDGNRQWMAGGYVNISIVDEALFSLSDQEVATLESLYGWVDGGLTGLTGSHNNQGMDNRYGYAGMATGATMTMDTVTEEAAEMAMGRDGGANQMTMKIGGADIAVRSNFKDTAYFEGLRLDEQGRGSWTFTLPDNVTSWRVTAAGITENLYAGTNVSALKVTLPFFINTTINQTYLSGDVPYISVRGYGVDIDENTEIAYLVTEETTGYSAEASGKAYEQIHLPLFELETGTYKFDVKAMTDSGLNDGYQETVHVYDTYQQSPVTEAYQASKGLKISTREDEMTTLVFVDSNRGQVIPLLYRLYYMGGDRVDYGFVSAMASQMLTQLDGMEIGEKTISVGDYQVQDGGIALMTYGESDIMTTALMAGFIEDPVIKGRVKSYLLNQFYSGDLEDRGLALYGLASMGEAVLGEINHLADMANLSERNQLYIAAAYGALGDTYMAKLIFDEQFMPNIEEYDETARYMTNGNGDMEMTGMLLPLVSTFDLSLAHKLNDFVGHNVSETYLPLLDQLTYVEAAMDSMPKEGANMSYNYMGDVYNVDLTNGFGQSITLPSSKLSEWMVGQVEGDVMIYAHYDGMGTVESSFDENLSLERHYELAKTSVTKTTFNTGDIVKVVIDWNINKDAIDDVYRITDYAPSGLVPIANAAAYGMGHNEGWYVDIDGQAVNFYVSKYRTIYRPMVYYARVISAGTFTGDQTIMRGVRIEDSMTILPTTSITVDWK